VTRPPRRSAAAGHAIACVSLLAVLVLSACGSTSTPAPPRTPNAGPPPTAASPAATQARPTHTPTPTDTPSATPLEGTPNTGLPLARVRVGSASFTAEVAATPASRATGLSYRDAMADDQAMWFDFGQPAMTSFWMKGMRFPLDMVWVGDDLRVIEVTANVPSPSPGTPEGQLPLYRPASPFRFVLEINAGLAARHGIAPGATVAVDAVP